MDTPCRYKKNGVLKLVITQDEAQKRYQMHGNFCCISPSYTNDFNLIFHGKLIRGGGATCAMFSDGGR